MAGFSELVEGVAATQQLSRVALVTSLKPSLVGGSVRPACRRTCTEAPLLVATELKAAGTVRVVSDLPS